MKNYFIHSFLILLIFISACSNQINPSQEYIIPDEAGFANAYFCPRDDCEAVLLEAISKSSKIDCAFYDLDLENVITALNNKNTDGNVRLFIDNENRKDVEGLSFVKFDNGNQLSHNKFCVFNDNFIITGSMNPTNNDAFKNNNNLIFIESESLAQNYNEEFEELWTGNFGKGNRVTYYKITHNGAVMENYFCPEDSCEDKVINLIRNAKNRIYFMTFSFTSDQIGDEIIRKHSEGVEVKGIFEKSQNNAYTEYKKMEQAELNVIFDKNSNNMHHKVFIIDDVVVTGSYNPTKNGNENNDENILIINNREIVESYVAEFNYLWNAFK